MRSPKQVLPGGQSVEKRWYPYYAGYSQAFVDDALNAMKLEPGSTILDPWNGSGTTTVRAAALGYRSVGLDANPVLVLVGKGRLLQSEVASSISPLAAEVLDTAQQHLVPLRNEPLLRWLAEDTALYIRGLERAIQKLLVEHETYQPLKDRNTGDVSTLASMFYVALFGTVRDTLRELRGSNPTWVREPKIAEDRVSSPRTDVAARFITHADRLATYISNEGLNGAGSQLACVRRGDSTSIDVGPDPADAVLTSPPYCTRIDYVISTAPELAVLGYDGAAIRELRDRMIGTPTIHSEDSEMDLGPRLNRLLSEVKAHTSKASSTYYHRYYEQYFRAMAKSLDSLTASCKMDSQMVLVLQDSYYKDIHIDLPRLVTDLAAQRGWTVVRSHRFHVQRTKAAVNPGSRKYRKSFEATETALFLARTH